MKNILLITAASLGFAMSSPAIAQDTGTHSETGEVAAQEIDPARLAVAQKTVDHLFPLGTYERMMKGTMDKIMDSVLGSMGKLTMADMAGISGQGDEDVSEDVKSRTMAETMREFDPHFDQRMKISTRVMMNEMVVMMTKMEPQIRETLARIYARKYTAAQLTEMNIFFSSETGSGFARDYMMVFVDPEMMQSMMSMVPEMMQAMPAITEKVKEATAHLPPPKYNKPDHVVEEAVE